MNESRYKSKGRGFDNKKIYLPKPRYPKNIVTASEHEELEYSLPYFVLDTCSGCKSENNEEREVTR